MKISNKNRCQFDGCKFQAQKNEDFCGKHLKISKKMKNPDIYCTKKNCCNLKKNGYQCCEKCYNNQLKVNEKIKD